MTVVLIRTGAKDGGGDAENPAAGNKKSINCLMKYSSTVLKKILLWDYVFNKRFMMTVTDSFCKMMNFSDTFFLFYSLREFCTSFQKKDLNSYFVICIRVDEYRLYRIRFFEI